MLKIKRTMLQKLINWRKKLIKNIITKKREKNNNQVRVKYDEIIDSFVS
jgi:hypothetical protein